jgi:hypothetical protein
MTTNARLITSFEIIDGQNEIAFETAGLGIVAAWIPPGTYWFSGDGSSTDFIAALNDAIPLVFAINGVSGSDSSVAQGRLTISNSGGFDKAILLDHALTTMPAAYARKLLGAHQSTIGIVNNTTVVSTHVHGFGWYPQQPAAEDIVRRFLHNSTTETLSGHISTVQWRTGKDQSIRFQVVGAPLSRLDHGNSLSADYGLTNDDPNAPFEQWVIDLATDAAKAFRYYPSITDTSTFFGPYRFPGFAPLRADPLAPPSRPASGTAESWTIIIPCREAAGTASTPTTPLLGGPGVGGWNFSQTNDDSRISSTQGVQVTLGANDTKGAYVSSMVLTQDCWELVIVFHNGTTTAAARPALCDVGIDPTGGTSYSVLIPDLVAGPVIGINNNGSPGLFYRFPIFIPAGARIGVAGQVGNAFDSLTVRCWMTAFGDPIGAEPFRGTQVIAYGVDAANSGGAEVVPGTTNMGNWYEIGTIQAGQIPKCVSVMFSHDNAVMGTAQPLTSDLSVGSSAGEYIINRNMITGYNTSEQCFGQENRAWIPSTISAGHKFYVRAQSSSTIHAGIGAIVWGVL